MFKYKVLTEIHGDNKRDLGYASSMEKAIELIENDACKEVKEIKSWGNWAEVFNNYVIVKEIV